MPTRQITVNLDLTPEELAERFCEMSGDEQARVFNHIAVCTTEWNGPWASQAKSIAASLWLNKDGRQIIDTLSHYAWEEPHGI